MTEVMVGCYDEELRPWCIRCWSKESKLSTNLILLGRDGSGAKCSQCGTVLSDTFPDEESTGLRIHLDGENCWEDLRELDKAGKLIWLNSPVLQIARLPRGMQSGASSVSIRIDLPDGKVVVAETTMKLFLGCADAFKAAEGKDKR